MATTGRGLLLTCLWYIREVDPVTLLLTGLTRDGVYLVEDGEVVGAVNNFRFNESPLGVLDRATEAGVTERALSREWSEWAQPHGHAAAAGGRLQHELGEPGDLSVADASGSVRLGPAHRARPAGPGAPSAVRATTATDLVDERRRCANGFLM